MANWNGVSEFVAVAELGSFTAAAKRLGVSVAHVSRQVSEVEDRLGAKLFYRTTRKVTLTEPGQLYFQHCHPLLDGLEEAERAIVDLSGSPKGKIRLTAPVVYGELEILPWINEFLLAHERLEIEMVLSNRQQDLVQEGFDLAIRLGAVAELGTSMMARKLAARTLYICGAPTYLAEHGVPKSLEELEQHQCLLGTLDYWRFEEKGRERRVQVRGRLRCNSGPALLDAALKGIGLVQLPDYYVRSALDSGALQSVLSPFGQPSEGIWAIYPRSRHLSRKVTLLMDYLAKRIEEERLQGS